MRPFQKTIFPFSTTGAVCNLSAYEFGGLDGSASESQFMESLQLLNEFEISKFLFYGFTQEKGWEFYKSKLEISGFLTRIVQLPALPTLQFGHKDAIQYLKSLDELFSFIGKSNFKLFFPIKKKSLITEFIFSSFLYLDNTLTVDDLEDYFLAPDQLLLEEKSKLESYSQFLNTSPYLVLGKFPSLKERAEFIHQDKKKEPEIPNQIQAGEFDLNLSALAEKEPPILSEQPFELNLSSFEQEDNSEINFSPPEDPQELLEDVLGFAENFEPTEAPIEWEDAFPDTGQKVESNVSSEKPNSNHHKIEEPEEDFTFSTLIDLDAITNGKLQAMEAEASSFDVSDPKVPFPDVLEIDNLSLTEWEEELTIAPESNKEETHTGETIQVNAVEINVDPSATFIDRHIKDALTKEILEGEQDPRKKKDPTKKKETKPVTIIVTAEKKEEDVYPLSKENLKKVSKDFNAIQLD